jgi:hypothetical protein
VSVNIAAPGDVVDVVHTSLLAPGARRIVREIVDFYPGKNA